jgi:hypothetical protein
LVAGATISGSGCALTGGVMLGAAVPVAAVPPEPSSKHPLRTNAIGMMAATRVRCRPANCDEREKARQRPRPYIVCMLLMLQPRCLGSNPVDRRLCVPAFRRVCQYATCSLPLFLIVPAQLLRLHAIDERQCRRKTHRICEVAVGCSGSSRSFVSSAGNPAILRPRAIGPEALRRRLSTVMPFG